MPPKDDSKKKEEKPLLGRPGNTVRMGLVGMPNVGKSSLFNLLSALQVPAEAYPFCTIDPTETRVEVSDERYDFLCKTFKPASCVPAFLRVTDIAGLVKGASEGKGLGNAFLSHINAVDGIYHVLRGFADKAVEHVEGEVDPVRDLDIIHNELRQKDLAQMKTIEEPLARALRTKKDKVKEFELETIRKVLALLESGKDVRDGDWNSKEAEVLAPLPLLTAKPVVYVVNILEKDFLSLKNKWLAKIQEWVKANSPSSPVIPFSAILESKLKAMDAEEKKKFLEEQKTKSMVNKIIHAGYDSLRLIHYFTAGEDEVKCWTVRKGTLAPGAAGVIHSDFEKGFICAETMAFADFKELGSESAVKAGGKYRKEGKMYEVQDGDIFNFKFNAPKQDAKKKDK